MNNQDNSWVRPTILKYTADVLIALSAIIRAARRNGRFSSNDVEANDVIQRKAIGVAFKTLGRFGMRKTGSYIPSTKTKRHGGIVAVWEVIDYHKLNSFMRGVQAVLLETKKRDPFEQLGLGV